MQPGRESIGNDWLIVELAEAVLRLNTEPAVLARVLSNRGGHSIQLEPSADDTLRAIQERLLLAAKDLAESRNALRVTRSSWSWRLTAPLRGSLNWIQILSKIIRHAGGLWMPRRWSGLLQWGRYRRSIRNSALFDAQYYLRCNPDVARLGLNALFHYFVFGSDENRKPNCLFDGEYYRNCHPDVATSAMNPLVHYMRKGAWEGYNPHPCFDSHYYLTQNEELRAVRWNPLSHFLGPGIVEGYNPNPSFNSLAYLEQNRALATLGINPVLLHLESRYQCSQ
jgi:hypothetical protein